MGLGLGIAIFGAALASILGGVGSAIGVSMTAQVANGVLSEDPEKFGTLFLPVLRRGDAGCHRRTILSHLARSCLHCWRGAGCQTGHRGDEGGDLWGSGRDLCGLRVGHHHLLSFRHQTVSGKISRITDKIMREARAEAKRIKSEFKRKARELEAEYDQRIEAQRREAQKRVEDLARGLKERRISEAEIGLRLEYLKYRYQLLDELITEAVSKIPKNKGYFQFLTDILKNSNWEEGEILLSAEDRKRFGSRLLAWCDKNGYAFRLSDQDLDTIGGLIIRKGKEAINATLDTIIDELRDELLLRIGREVGLE